MNKDNRFVFVVILLCFIIVNIMGQLVLNDGYIEEKLSPSGYWIQMEHMEHTLMTRMLATFPSVLILLIIFVGLSKDDPWLVWVDKKIAGDRVR